MNLSWLVMLSPLCVVRLQTAFGQFFNLYLWFRLLFTRLSDEMDNNSSCVFCTIKVNLFWCTTNFLLHALCVKKCECAHVVLHVCIRVCAYACVCVCVCVCVCLFVTVCVSREVADSHTVLVCIRSLNILTYIPWHSLFLQCSGQVTSR